VRKGLGDYQADVTKPQNARIYSGKLRSQQVSGLLDDISKNFDRDFSR